MGAPLILVVTADEAVRVALVGDIDRRFAADYGVAGVASGDAAEAVARASRGRGDEVALVIVDQAMGDAESTTVLARVRAVAPTAKRVLLVRRGDWSAAHPLVTAMALGHVDYHLYNPWRPLERILYPAVSDFLAAWDKLQDATSVPVRIVGAPTSPGSHELRDALTRVAVPFWFFDSDSVDGQQILDELGMGADRLPVVAFWDGPVLVEPRLSDVWGALGVATHVDVEECDVVVVGAGPAGLACAVYAASEGLDTLVLDPGVPGGQAVTSSLIRNYLGFHRGVSGDDLASRAVEQAWLFGTRFVLSQSVVSVAPRGPSHVVTTSAGSEVAARAVVLATGVAWRRLGVPALEDLVGKGVFYGAAGAEARAMEGRQVFVVGAGNSAGQATMHLARYAESVTVIVRGDSLRRSMSDYLVTELEEAQNVRVLVNTEVVDGAGTGYLDSLTLRTRQSDRDEVVPASALFLLIGAEPRTEWLGDVVARDRQGYVLTGRDVVGDDRGAPTWPLARPPMLLETSMPGVFAAGDVRHGSVKRVAAAVGEGSTAIQLVHEYFRDGDPG